MTQIIFGHGKDGVLIISLKCCDNSFAMEGENKYLWLCDIYDVSIEMKTLRRRANLMGKVKFSLRIWSMALKIKNMSIGIEEFIT